jgi:negative regulator of sigma E activity
MKPSTAVAKAAPWSAGVVRVAAAAGAACAVGAGVVDVDGDVSGAGEQPTSKAVPMATDNESARNEFMIDLPRVWKRRH